jgi:hypothetical protein
MESPEEYPEFFIEHSPFGFIMSDEEVIEGAEDFIVCTE